jgi:hypothetical protein
MQRTESGVQLLGALCFANSVAEGRIFCSASGTFRDTLSALTDEVRVQRVSSFPDIESDATAFDARLATMENRDSSFEVRSAKRSSHQINIDEASRNEQEMYARYEHDLLLALLASNLAQMTYVSCSCKTLERASTSRPAHHQTSMTRTSRSDSLLTSQQWHEFSRRLRQYF